MRALRNRESAVLARSTHRCRCNSAAYMHSNSRDCSASALRAAPSSSIRRASAVSAESWAETQGVGLGNSPIWPWTCRLKLSR